MKKSFVCIWAIFCGMFIFGYVTGSNAQTVGISNIRVEQFPKVKATVVMFDKTGAYIRPEKSEITIKENGLSRIVRTLTCTDNQAPQAVSLIVGIDASVSMNIAEAQEPPLLLSITSVQSFLDNIALTGSEFTLQTCDMNAQVLQSITTNRQSVRTALSTITTKSGNNFVEQLFNPVSGLIVLAGKSQQQKAIVLCTDARNDALSEQDVQKCIALCRVQNIRFCSLIYTSTLSDAVGIRTSLQQIADSTNGFVFEGITTTADAIAKAKALQQLLQGVTPCTVEWMSDYHCSTEVRNVEIQNTGINSKGNSYYLLPAGGISRLQASLAEVHFYNSKPGIKHDTTITLTAKNIPFVVTAINSSNPAFSVSPTSFSLAVGQEITLTLSCIPQDSGYAWSQLTVVNGTCPTTLFVSSGYTGIRPTKSTLQITFPNGKEKLIAGLDTTIRWTGIPLTDSVMLEYSTNKGKVWSILTNKSSGGVFNWKQVPPLISDECLLRVQQLAPFNDRGWAHSIGSVGNDRSNVVAVDSIGNVVVAGTFYGTTVIGTDTLVSYGNTDVFIAKYNRLGQILWARNAGGKDNDEAHGLAIDNKGNIFITGHFTNSSAFESITIKGVKEFDVFLAKYSESGHALWAKGIGSVGFDHGNAVALDNKGNVIIAGDIAGVATFGDTVVNTHGSWDSFVAKYKTNGDFLWVHTDGGNDWDEAKSVTCDTSGNIYTTGIVTGVSLFNNVTVRSAGGSDIFVAKYDANSKLLWVKNYGSAYDDKGNGIASDKNGNLYVVGSFNGIARFDTNKVVSSGNQDIFISELNTNGSLLWVRRAGGALDDEALSVCYDSTNAVNVVGYCMGTSLFSGDTIKCFGMTDAFVARYTLKGTIVSVEHEGADSTDRANSIVVSRDNNIYVAGSISRTVNLEAEELRSKGLEDAVVWRVGQKPIQIDVSDSVWTILAPVVDANDIDMGKIPIGIQKDSLIRNVVVNSGQYSFVVKEIVFKGKDSLAFSIVSGTPPLLFNPSQVHPIEIRFTPNHIGQHSCTMLIITPFDTTYRTITGEGLMASIRVEVPVLDFGRVWINTRRDSLISVSIRNVGSTPITITNTRVVGTSANPVFSIMVGGGSFTLEQGQSRLMMLSFTPSLVGRVNGLIEFDYDGYGSPARIIVYGEGFEDSISVVLKMDDVSAFIGDDISVPLYIAGGNNIVQSGTTKLSATLLCNGTILAPIEITPRGILNNNILTIPIEGQIPAGTFGLLTTLRFRVGLGNDTSCTVSVADVTVNKRPVGFKQTPARISVLGVCKSEGGRLINPNGEVSLGIIHPNPATSSCVIEFETIENGVTDLYITDILGHVVSTVVHAELPVRNHNVVIQTSLLPSGSYYLILRTPSIVKVARLEVVQ